MRKSVLLNKPSVIDKMNRICYDEDISKIRLFQMEKRLFKGLKQTIKLIESGECEAIYIAKDIKDKEYEDLLISLCDTYGVAKRIILDSWHELRDLTMEGIVPSYIIKEKAKREGLRPIIRPKCFVASVKKGKEQ